MNSRATTIISMVLLTAAQVLVLNRIHLFGYATPLLLVYVLLLLPLHTSRGAALLLGFALGMVSDMFTNTPGVAAMTLTAIAFLQQPLLRALLPRNAEDDFAPSLRSLGRMKYFTYSGILTLLACALHFFLEECTLSHLPSTLLTIVSSTLLTYIFILTFESLRRE